MKLIFVSRKHYSSEFVFAVDPENHSYDEIPALAGELEQYFASINTPFQYSKKNKIYVIGHATVIFSDPQIKEIFIKAGASPDDWQSFENSVANAPVNYLTQMIPEVLKDLVKKQYLGLFSSHTFKRTSRYNYHTSLIDYNILMQLHFPDDYRQLNVLTDPPTENNVEKRKFVDGVGKMSVDYKIAFQAACKRDYSSARQKRLFSDIKEGNLAAIQQLDVQVRLMSALKEEDAAGLTGIYWLHKNKHQHILNYVYSHKNDIDEDSCDFSDPLSLAIICKQPIEIIKAELAKDVSSETKAFIYAAQYGYLEALKLFTLTPPAEGQENNNLILINDTDGRYLRQALRVATYYCQVEVLNYLCELPNVDVSTLFEDPIYDKSMLININAIDLLINFAKKNELDITTYINNIFTYLQNRQYRHINPYSLRELCGLAVKHNIKLNTLHKEYGALQLAIQTNDPTVIQHVYALYKYQEIPITAYDLVGKVANDLSTVTLTFAKAAAELLCEISENENIDLTVPLDGSHNNVIPIVYLFGNAAQIDDIASLRYIYNNKQYQHLISSSLIDVLLINIKRQLPKQESLESLRYLIQLCNWEEIDLNGKYKEVEDSSILPQLVYAAAGYGRTDIINFLYHLVPENIRITVGHQAISHAASHSQISIVSALFNENKSKPKSRLDPNFISEGASYLHRAAQNSDWSQDALINILITNGADIELPIPANTSILLDHNKGLGNQLINLIKSKHNDELPETIPGFTPLHLAILFGNLENAKILVKHGANLEKKTNSMTIEEMIVVTGNRSIYPTIWSATNNYHFAVSVKEAFICAFSLSSTEEIALDNFRSTYRMAAKMNPHITDEAVSDAFLELINTPSGYILHKEISVTNFLRHDLTILRTLQKLINQGDFKRFEQTLNFISDARLNSFEIAQKFEVVEQILYQTHCIINVNFKTKIYSQLSMVAACCEDMSRLNEDVKENIKNSVNQFLHEDKNSENILSPLINYFLTEQTANSLFVSRVDFKIILFMQMLIEQSSFQNPVRLNSLIDAIKVNSILLHVLETNQKFLASLNEIQQRILTKTASDSIAHHAEENVEEQKEGPRLK